MENLENKQAETNSSAENYTSEVNNTEKCSIAGTGTSLPTKAFSDVPCRIIGILSGKGGVGKTFISSTLSYGLAAKGLSVLVIDMDTGLRNLDIVMGLDDSVIYNLFDTLERDVPYENILVKSQGYKGDNVPWVILTSHLQTKNAISSKSFCEMLNKARERFDIILLDGPAGIEYGADIVAEASDEIFVVCNQEKASLRAGCQIKSKYDHLCPLSLIVNSYSPALVEKNDGGLPPDKASLLTGINLIAAVPWDLSVRPCGHRGVPVWYIGPVSPARNVIEELSHNLYKKMYNGEDSLSVPGVRATKKSQEENHGSSTANTAPEENPSQTDVKTDNEPKGIRKFFGKIFGSKK